MNINQIKLFTWLVSAGVTVGVGYYVYEFNQRTEQWRTERRIPVERAQEILDSAEIPEGPIASLVSKVAIEPPPSSHKAWRVSGGFSAPSGHPQATQAVIVGRNPESAPLGQVCRGWQ